VNKRQPRRRGLRVAPEVLLAVVATAWAIDISPDLMVAGIETFEPGTEPVRSH
jgi:cyanophycin synthetase